MNKVFFGDCRDSMKKLAAEGVKVQTCVTSPPYYGLRNYEVDGQLGLEETPEEYISNMVKVFRCVWDILADDGTLWINIGDSYGKEKQLLMIPARVALALQSDGWVLRQDIIWSKGNPMPESVKDRCTKSHEYIFLLSKSSKYYYDNEAIKYLATSTDTSNRDRDGTRLNNTPGRSKMGGLKTNDYTMANKRSVWTVNTKPYRGAHFAVYPIELIEPCILAGSRVGDIVLDPFMGSGTTAAAALTHNRQYIGCELNKDYESLQLERLATVTPKLIF